MNPKIDFKLHLHKPVEFLNVSLPEDKSVYFFNEAYGGRFGPSPYSALSFKMDPIEITKIKDINVEITHELHVKAGFYWVSDEERTSKGLQRKGLLKDDTGEIPVYVWRKPHIACLSDKKGYTITSLVVWNWEGELCLYTQQGSK